MIFSIKLPIEISTLSSLIEYTDLCGYIDHVSENLIKAKGKDTTYFILKVITETDQHRVVCFDCDKYEFFQDIKQRNAGCTISNVEIASNGYIYGYKSTSNECNLKFKKPKITAKLSLLSEVKDNCQQYDIVNISGKIISANSTEKSQEGLPYRQCVIVDTSNITRELTLYGKLTSQVEPQKCYMLTDLNVVIFKGFKCLKTTESTHIEAVPESSMKIAPHIHTSFEKSIVGIISSIDFHTLKKTHKCPKCYSVVTPDDGLILCDHCDTATPSASSKAECTISFVIESPGRSVSLQAPSLLMENLASVTVDSKKAFCKQLLSMSVKAQYDSNNLVTKISTQNSSTSTKTSK